MPYGPVAIYRGSIASGASTLTSLDLDKSWSRVYLDISSLSTAAELTVFASSDGTTFRPLFERVNTGAVSCQTVTIPSNSVANGGVVFFPHQGIRYLQFRASAVVSGGVSINAICAD